MHDIFLSYSTKDRDRLKPLVAALEQLGWSVFWDHQTVPIGKHWQNVIGQAIRDSRCVVVAWSKHSAQSEWVIEEALEGKKRGVLLPIRLDTVDIPFGFGLFQAGDFTRWGDTANHPEFTKLVGEIQVLLGARKTVTVVEPITPKPIQAPPVTMSGHYRINGDGTVTDTNTKLMWKRCSEGQSGNDCSGEADRYTWNDAMAKFGKGVSFLGLGKKVSFAGYNDWRIPTIDELRTLVDKSQRPTIDQVAFPNTPAYLYWSSSTKDASFAWFVYFNGGGDYWDDRLNGGAVRLVRSGQ